MSFRSLDFFRKVNQDIDTTTISGGFYSLLALAVLINFSTPQLGALLFYTELAAFTRTDVDKLLTIDNDASRHIRINLNITLFNSPCHSKLISTK